MKIVLKKKNKDICIICTIITLVIYAIYCFAYGEVGTGKEYNLLILALSWLQIGIVVYVLYTWKMISNKLFTPYIIIALFLILYGCGQSILWAFNIHQDYEIGKGALYGVYGIQSDSEIVHMMLYISICLLFFHLGALFCIKRPRRSKLTRNNRTDREILFKVSVFIFVVSLFLVYGVLRDVLDLALKEGYAAMFSSGKLQNNPLLQLSTELFFPAMVGLLIGSNYSKWIVRVAYLLFAIYAVGYSVAGSRGSWFPYLIALIWLHIKHNGGMTKKTWVILGCIAFLLMYILELIVLYRSGSDLTEIFQISHFPLFSLVAEMGGSAAVTLIALARQLRWPYDNSLLVSILAAPTTQLAQALNKDVVAGANWFSYDVLRIDWGSGFSIFAELYVNYNEYIAPLLMFVVGWIIASLLYEDDEITFMNSPLRVFGIAACMGVFMIIGRCALLELTRKVMRGVVLYMLMVIVMRKALQKNRIGKEG